jgi:hypothetical protein
MKLLESTKFELPVIFLITSRGEIKNISAGVPFILASLDNEEDIIRMLEYEVLLKNALQTGYPFDFKKILIDAGYDDIEDFDWQDTIFMDYVSSSNETLSISLLDDERGTTSLSTRTGTSMFKNFIRDSSCYVDLEKLKSLNVFPIWLDKVEDAVFTNLHNYTLYNPYMYSKQLGGIFGGEVLVSPSRNLIIGDISSSIPRAVSTTFLMLFKHLAESMFADIMITGSKTTLYPYEELHNFNVDTIYEENGMGNEQAYFKKLVTSEVKHYGTAIVFGDNHSPCDRWKSGDRIISREDGKKMNLWTIDKLISFHTTSDEIIAGYADWFEPKEVELVSNWVNFLKK